MRLIARLILRRTRALFDNPRRIAHRHNIIGHILDYDASGTDKRKIAYIRHDYAAFANECTSTNIDSVKCVFACEQVLLDFPEPVLASARQN